MTRPPSKTEDVAARYKPRLNVCPLVYSAFDDRWKALKQFFIDRNPKEIHEKWGGTVSNHASTERFNYTVPTNRKAFIATVGAKINKAFTATKKGSCTLTLNSDVDAIYLYGQDSDTATEFNAETIVLQFYVLAGTYLKGFTFHNDDVIDHPMAIFLLAFEFDA